MSETTAPAPSSKPIVFWVPPAPETCDLCQRPLTGTFIDGCLSSNAGQFAGRWANICPECHTRHGCGLGTGKGQRYTWSAEHKAYAKTEG